ncbi:hypothetical protein LJC04_04470 [Ruminococcaceae bacterium OttesenSCG-928-O06]|nr:hypothetical protein [Ruminococcaceae bacterium OttesenSCG-928-O06]
MELFRKDGHLADEGLQALVNGELDEMGRLEAAEHLDFCDECLGRHLRLLQDDVLLAPPAPLQPAVMRRVRSRGRRVVFARYGAVAAAAVLAVGIWGLTSRALPGMGGVPATGAQQPPSAQVQQPAGQPATGIGDRIGAAVNNAASGVGSFFGNMFSPRGGATQEDTITQTQEALARQQRQREEEERKKKEEVFERQKVQPQPEAANTTTPGGQSGSNP